ncbi:hypothetical protein PENTCL1PPCAC_21050, partial [Pristionchus entomophagus]
FVNVTQTDQQGRFSMQGVEDEICGQFRYFIQVEVECDNRTAWQRECADQKFIDQCNKQPDDDGWKLARFTHQLSGHFRQPQGGPRGLRIPRKDYPCNHVLTPSGSLQEIDLSQRYLLYR